MNTQVIKAPMVTMMQSPNMFSSSEEWDAFNAFLANALKEARLALREEESVVRKGAPVLRYSKRPQVAMRPIRRHEVDPAQRRKGRR